jgi:hypothetical protein
MNKTEGMKLMILKIIVIEVTQERFLDVKLIFNFFLLKYLFLNFIIFSFSFYL